jgi:hypothetical protein
MYVTVGTCVPDMTIIVHSQNIDFFWLWPGIKLTEIVLEKDDGIYKVKK